MSLLAAASLESLDVSPFIMFPFGALLLSIALGPLFFPVWWRRHYPHVALGLGVVTAGYYLLVLKSGDRMVSVAHDYVSFMALIGSLFVVAGGIHITVKGESRPIVNVLFLLTGAIVANVIGTTGASMLMIRPWIRMNRYRITAFHVIFFIFIVSNVGGCLTPLGDPPLFLGYLKGVPFLWVLENCWKPWLVVVGSLLAIFYILDWMDFRQAPRRVSDRLTRSETWHFAGRHNLIFIGLIVGAVLGNRFLPPLVPELVMAGAAAASFFSTSALVHKSNDFDFEPVKEVGWLFAGIFATMVPVLDYLEIHAGEIGLHTAQQFYWATGSLSAFLDNAPTYLTFLAAAMGNQGLSINSREDIASFIQHGNEFLVAISLGAVFFGAGTYIGNGPHFMVKNIAQQVGVRTPTFFGYVFRDTVPVLLPVLTLVTLLCFSRWRVF
ncbi:MAG TPA: sodium:proton antiporter [Terrimicrobiaceae bacterium]|nr:sodium:proton antiporter [Terrimicrobiaceae bacterium]